MNRAEVCKEGYVKELMLERDKRDYKSGKLKLEMSEDYDYCEGCSKLRRYVIGDNKKPISDEASNKTVKTYNSKDNPFI